jgi:hypothetical protein
MGIGVQSFTPGKETRYHCTRGWVGPRAGLDVCGNLLENSSHNSGCIWCREFIDCIRNGNTSWTAKYCGVYSMTFRIEVPMFRATFLPSSSRSILSIVIKLHDLEDGGNILFRNSVTIYQTTRTHSPGDLNLHQVRTQNFSLGGGGRLTLRLYAFYIWF